MGTTQEQYPLIESNGKPLVEVKEEENLSPLVLLDRAMQKNLPPETLKQFMDFVERVDAMNARKAFVKAMALFKMNPPEITKNKHVKIREGFEYDHATLDHACEKIIPALAAVGITHCWETAQKEGVITVTCVLTHELGHSERTILQGLPEDSGSKNKIQAVGSTVSYLERYTLLAATGLAAENQDDDGRGGIKMPDFVARLAEIYAAQDRRSLQAIFTTHFSAAAETKDEKAAMAFTKAKDERKEQLPK